MKTIFKRQPTAGVILAAGTASRFGSLKQLITFRGQYVLERVLNAALASNLEKVILVLGHAHQEIVRALGERLRHPRLELVINPQYEQGLSQSLRRGIKKLGLCRSVMFLLGDQPLINSESINFLLERFWASDKDICVPIFQGQRGNPVIFTKQLCAEIKQIQGDIGAREIIQANSEKTLFIEIDQPYLFFDIDTPEDLRKLETLID